jgi:hypothetical protein
MQFEDEADILAYINQHITNSHHDVAKFMKKMYGNIYRPVLHPTNSQRFIWQEQIEGIWRDMPKAIELHKRMTTEIIPYIQKAKHITKRKGSEATNEIDAEYQVMKLKELHKLEANLL